MYLSHLYNYVLFHFNSKNTRRLLCSSGNMGNKYDGPSSANLGTLADRRPGAIIRKPATGTSPCHPSAAQVCVLPRAARQVGRKLGPVADSDSWRSSPRPTLTWATFCHKFPPRKGLLTCYRNQPGRHRSAFKYRLEPPPSDPPGKFFLDYFC